MTVMKQEQAAADAGMRPSLERRLTSAEVRRAKQARELGTLLAQRPDLRGTYAPADMAVEAVRWSA